MALMVFPCLSIAAEPSTFRQLFIERFDDANFAARGWYDIAGSPAIVQDTDRGSNVMEITYANTGDIGPTPNPGRRIHFEATDTIYVSYHIKYSANWTWTGFNYGPHEFTILTDVDTDYTGPARTHMTGYIEGQNGYGVLAIQDGVNVNTSLGAVPNNLVETTEQRAVAGCNGSTDTYGAFATCYQSGTLWFNGKTWKTANPILTAAAWHKVEALFKMNSVVGGKGVADGHLKYWVDGIILMDREDVVFRTGQYPTMKWDQFLIGPYFHNGVRNPQSYRIDDLVFRVPTDTASKIPSPPGGLRSSP